MTSIDNDPQLQGMLWDDAVLHVNDLAATQNEAMRKIAVDISKALANVFVIYLARNPKVDAIAFSLTEAEYDDEGYGGYDFTEVRPRFNQELLTTDEAKDFITDQYGEFIQTFGPRPDELSAALDDALELDKVLIQAGSLIKYELDTCGIIVTRDAMEFYYGSDDLSEWVRKRT